MAMMFPGAPSLAPSNNLPIMFQGAPSGTISNLPNMFQGAPSGTISNLPIMFQGAPSGAPSDRGMFQGASSLAPSAKSDVSEVSKKASPQLPVFVSTPSALGSTTLPKATLSYRWVLRSAKTHLQNIGVGLRSPECPVPLPLLKTKPESERTSLWHLFIHETSHIFSGVKQTSISLCQGKKTRPPINESNFYHQLQPRCASTKYEAMIQCDSMKSKVMISGCTFTIVNFETNETMYSTTAPAKECEISEMLSSCISVDYSNIDKYLCNDTLAIQVDATLLCLTDSIETLEKACKIPSDNVREEMHTLYKDEVFTDMIIKCGGKEFKVHKAILASQSPVFKKMLEVNMSERRSNIVKISDIDPSVMSDLLAYFYAGIAPNVTTLAKDLLNVANKYELPRLFAVCENELMMKIKVSNVVEMLFLADLHNATYLKNACLRFIHYNSAEVHKTSKWKYLKGNLDKCAALFFEIVEFTP